MSKPKITAINHLAIVVEDIDTALNFWRDSLGLQLSHTEDVPSQQSRIAFLPVGGSEVELVQPIGEDSGVARYLEKRGPGMHHLCLEVDDIQAMLNQLKAKDVRLINETPQQRGGRKFAFIHPESAGGVLVELYELLEK